MSEDPRYTAEDLERAAWQARTDTKLDGISTQLATTTVAITDLAARKEESHAGIYRRISDSEATSATMGATLRGEIGEVRSEVAAVRIEVAELVGKLKLGGAALVVGASSLTAVLTRLIG